MDIRVNKEAYTGTATFTHVVYLASNLDTCIIGVEERSRAISIRT